MFQPSSFAGRGRGGGGGPQQQQLQQYGGGGGGASGSPGKGGRGGGGGSDGASTSGVRVLRPVTILMLHKASRVGEGAMIVDGREVTQVSVVGRILEVDASGGGSATAKSHSYKITDGTGTITVRHWLEASRVETPLVENDYVRAVGLVKTFQERPVITGTVRKLSDVNEVTFHYLDTIATHLRITKGEAVPLPQVARAVGGRPSTGGYAATAAPVPDYGGAASAVAGPLHEISASDSAFPSRVFLALKHALAESGGSGASLPQVVQKVVTVGRVPTATAAYVKPALEGFLQQGAIATVAGGAYIIP